MLGPSMIPDLVKFSVFVASKFVLKRVCPKEDAFMTVAACSKSARQMAEEANIVFVEAAFVEALEFALERKCTVDASGKPGFNGFRCVPDKAAYLYMETFKMAFEELRTRDGVKISLKVIGRFQILMDRMEFLHKVSAQSKDQVAKAVGFSSFEDLQEHIESLVAFS